MYKDSLHPSYQGLKSLTYNLCSPNNHVHTAPTSRQMTRPGPTSHNTMTSHNNVASYSNAVRNNNSRSLSSPFSNDHGKRPLPLPPRLSGIPRNYDNDFPPVQTNRSIPLVPSNLERLPRQTNKSQQLIQLLSEILQTM